MNTIIIAGGTGLVGTRLTELLLEREYNVITLSRNANLDANPIFIDLRKRFAGHLAYGKWNIMLDQIDLGILEQGNAIVNLSGASIMEERWSEKRKEVILNSRVQSSKLIVSALKKYPNNIDIVINASAIGWYGDDKYRKSLTPFNEDLPHANDFLGNTCYKWEESIKPVVDLGKRLVIFRLGIVLSNNGGAFPEFKRTLGMRIASVLGSGHQIISWIHIDDLCMMIIHAIENESVNGVYNAVAPYSVTNARMMKTIGERLHNSKFAQLKVPKTILKMALGEMSEELLKSCLVSSKKILDTGFEFKYPRIKDAVENLIKS